MKRRLLAGTLATAMLATTLTALGIAVPAAACACGAPATPEETGVTVAQERALVTFDGEIERIDMLLDMLTEGSETGLIVPTPTPATVSLGSGMVFDALERQTAPEIEVVENWWGEAPGDTAVGGTAPEVLSEVELGPITAVTLAASDASGLTQWLSENGYVIDAGVQELLGDYVDRGWSFAALSITGAMQQSDDEDGSEYAALLNGELEPVRLEFETTEVVYPLLLSQASTTPQRVRLYLFGENGMHATFPDGTTVGDVVWAGAVDQPTLLEFGDYLTVVEGYYGTPASEITGDVTITPTGERHDVTPIERRTTYVEVLGVPLGVAIAGAFGVLVLMMVIAIIGAIVHHRAEKRRRRAG